MTDTSPSPTDLNLARQRADEARTRFKGAFIGLRRRISPTRIKDDATSAAAATIRDAQDRAKQCVRRHPVITGTITIAGLALLFWKPARLLIAYGLRGAWFVWLNRAIWSRNDK